MNTVLPVLKDSLRRHFLQINYEKLGGSTVKSLHLPGLGRKSTLRILAWAALESQSKTHGVGLRTKARKGVDAMCVEINSVTADLFQAVRSQTSA